MGLLDNAVARERERRDPLSRLPWWARLLGLVLLTALVVAQVVLGSGLSRLLGLALLVLVVPAQGLSTAAAYKISRER